ncbi:hypothetical protein FI667_g8437, partial [Globisporangium splendens]
MYRFVDRNEANSLPRKSPDALRGASELGCGIILEVVEPVTIDSELRRFGDRFSVAGALHFELLLMLLRHQKRIGEQDQPHFIATRMSPKKWWCLRRGRESDEDAATAG